MKKIYKKIIKSTKYLLIAGILFAINIISLYGLTFIFILLLIYLLL